MVGKVFLAFGDGTKDLETTICLILPENFNLNCLDRNEEMFINDNPDSIEKHILLGRKRESTIIHESQNFWQALVSCKILIVIFILTLILPTYTSFAIGSMRFNPYRMFLIATMIPSMLSVFSRGGGVLLADFLLVAGTIWAVATLFIHHGVGDGLESGGIFLVESLGSYLFGRAVVVNKRDYESLVALMTALVIVLLPFTLGEAFTRMNFFGQPLLNTDMRLGLYRARGPFDHPIILGVFCASTFGMSWFCFPRSESPITGARCLRSCAIFFATLTSVSSGPLTAIIVQTILVVWCYLTSKIRHRWRLISGILLCVYIAIDLFSNRTPMRVFLTYLTFSSTTAYNRLTIWDWGFYKNVLIHPIAGIGFREWIRPDWMHSTSMDNFWLVLMVRHGLPCFLLIGAAGLYLLVVGARSAGGADIGVLQKGWVITIVGLSVAASTVHLWNAMFVGFFFLLGAGGWFCNIVPPRLERGSLVTENVWMVKERRDG